GQPRPTLQRGRGRPALVLGRLHLLAERGREPPRAQQDLRADAQLDLLDRAQDQLVDAPPDVPRDHADIRLRRDQQEREQDRLLPLPAPAHRLPEAVEGGSVDDAEVEAALDVRVGCRDQHLVAGAQPLGHELTIAFAVEQEQHPVHQPAPSRLRTMPISSCLPSGFLSTVCAPRASPSFSSQAALGPAEKTRNGIPMRRRRSVRSQTRWSNPARSISTSCSPCASSSIWSNASRLFAVAVDTPSPDNTSAISSRLRWLRPMATTRGAPFAPSAAPAGERLTPLPPDGRHARRAAAEASSIRASRSGSRAAR